MHTSFKKAAKPALSAADRKAIMEFLVAQKDEAAKRELQKNTMRARNRADRVFNAKVALMAMLGAGGAMLGGHAGRFLSGGNRGAVVGAISGAVGGSVLGNIVGGRLGNAKADRMEEEEDRTGVSVFDQNQRSMARQLNNWYMWDNHGPHGLGYSLLTR